jgi:hypothetical protein
MANRWIECVKAYARDKNISYTCAMSEIKTMNLYKPLKKEAIKEDPKIVTIKTKKTNQKIKEEGKPKKKDKKLKYNDNLQNLLKYLDSDIISRHPLKLVYKYIKMILQKK